jgi:hypothetical protein
MGHGVGFLGLDSVGMAFSARDCASETFS